MARMKHDFFKDPEGPTADRFLAWMEEETTSLLRRCLGDMEALKGAIFLYVNRAYEANMPDAQIGALFGKAFVRAGWPEEQEDAEFDLLESLSQLAEWRRNIP